MCHGCVLSFMLRELSRSRKKYSTPQGSTLSLSRLSIHTIETVDPKIEMILEELEILDVDPTPYSCGNYGFVIGAVPTGDFRTYV